MEYRGVAYTIRARPGLDEWTWTISRCDVTRAGDFSGSRGALVAFVENKIDRMFINQRTAQKRRALAQLTAGRARKMARRLVLALAIALVFTMLAAILMPPCCNEASAPPAHSQQFAHNHLKGLKGVRR
jgi:hypothetical protein